MNFRIISWNIAGGHPMASLTPLDYSPKDLGYFVSEMKDFTPDIICLQEAHTPKAGGATNAERVAEALGFQHVFNSPASISHIDADCMLSTAIVSRLRLLNTRTVFFPNPEVPLYWPDGKGADTHEKNIQIADVADFTIANNQMLPLTPFGYNYQDESHGGKLANGINQVMVEVIPNRPLIWCGDFNFPDPLSLYPHMKSLNLKDALPDQGTRPTKDGSKKRPDHIFYSPEFELKEVEIRQTNSDHYLCFAELALNNGSNFSPNIRV